MHNTKYTGLKAGLEQRLILLNIASENFELDECIFSCTGMYFSYSKSINFWFFFKVLCFIVGV